MVLLKLEFYFVYNILYILHSKKNPPSTLQFLPNVFLGLFLNIKVSNTNSLKNLKQIQKYTLYCILYIVYSTE